MPGLSNLIQRKALFQTSRHKSEVICIILEAVVRRCPVKKVFLEISRSSQENTCAIVSFLTFLNFAKILRTPFTVEHLWWLLLSLPSSHLLAAKSTMETPEQYLKSVQT